MHYVLREDSFNTIQQPKRGRFSFIPGILFFVMIGWGVAAIAHNKAAFSEPGRAARSAHASIAGIPLRPIPEAALSPEAAQGVMREKGLFDARRNPAGRGVSHQYEAHKNGTVVYDHVSDLTWQQAGSLKEMNYRDAKDYISALNKERFAGYHDWRLPTLEEAISLVEPARKVGDLHINPVFDPCQKRIWTSDFRKAGMAWAVWFDTAFCDYAYTDNNIKHSVRTVRTGR
ncbi:MAG: hypothetical protein AYP45_14535 [Candidatus Brocadia carolinensis]|uniref:Lcl C-terminal domain-containing protein n=1 Tax=Candidatus Brocadia carolinensis TaxID=1004156 RepID=A0A1V4AQR2_9BACT|nr:MAG: hypothetical protein AYP45_14535 [Candidatus Brocadia caroliniensis]